jgi:hypothetical protein
MIDVQYEDLVADQEGQTRRVLDFCGLEWDDRCLDFHQTDRPVLTASNWQIRQPIYTSSIGRWRNYAEHLQPLLATLGIKPRQASSDDAVTSGTSAVANADGVAASAV